MNHSSYQQSIYILIMIGHIASTDLDKKHASTVQWTMALA